ncbi:MAG: GlsB/YeaQ/YmgE family stress response membrane protein [Candidatus Acidiferrales bacterium]
MQSLASMLLQNEHDVIVYVQTHGVIWWIIIGLLAGWLAGTLSRGRGFGCVTNIILGLVGAVIGGWIFSKLGIVAFGFWGSLAAATVGAILLVAVARLFAGSGSSE